tara:strand:+ start:987 stop:1172 length:186 start_codon:yes stop_codon:yes gene_type:complete
VISTGVNPKPKSTLDSQKVAKKIAAKNGSLRFFSIRNQIHQIRHFEEKAKAMVKVKELEKV